MVWICNDFLKQGSILAFKNRKYMLVFEGIFHIHRSLTVNAK